MQKNWFTTFNVKVTARVFVTKAWLFVLWFLNRWSISNQIWFDSGKKMDYCVQDEGHSEGSKYY